MSPKNRLRVADFAKYQILSTKYRFCVFKDHFSRPPGRIGGPLLQPGLKLVSRSLYFFLFALSSAKKYSSGVAFEIPAGVFLSIHNAP
jgi:hypothetical protein